MPSNQGARKNQSHDLSSTGVISPPAISLPKGGGAIRGIQEKFAVNPATGTTTFSIPIFTSAGRGGFSPQLSLSYDSGSGNGPFGFGWNLQPPSITRKTEKGVPEYKDELESDTYILSGAEDLVPVLRLQGDSWVREVTTRTENNDTYIVQPYRPRIEGLFSRIEQWYNQRTGDVHWRSVTKENITNVYGEHEGCRISDPNDSNRVFQWLLERVYDDKGNMIQYEYKQENPEGVDQSLPQEKNRLFNQSSYSKQYLKRIKYGNSTPFYPEANTGYPENWYFEVVLDYGEHASENPTTEEIQPWLIRLDPFSTFRAGFEIRTQRLCQRVLMFHHFPELGEEPCLVRSTNFTYRESPTATFLTATTQTGYQRINNSQVYETKSLPPLEFSYTEAEIDETINTISFEDLENLPSGLDNTRYQWVDLDGEGLAGLLTEQGGAWFYKRNLGETKFSPLETLATQPSLANLQPSGQQQLVDLAGDGQKDLVLFSQPIPGFFERSKDQTWHTFTTFSSVPQVDWDDPNLRMIDLNGDGHTDILLTEENVFTWYPSQAEAGFGPPVAVSKPDNEELGPTLVFANSSQSIFLADMTGDGLIDIARVRNGEICYWPNKGYGTFGAKVTMGDAPFLDHPDQFEQSRFRLADIDGSGTTDLIYLDREGVKIWFNQAGNSWSECRYLDTFPTQVNPANITIVDLLGNGTACLVWSSPLPSDAHQPVRFIDLMGNSKPYLLSSIKNNIGLEQHLTYAPSTRFYLKDKEAGTPWITRLHFPVHVLERAVTIDRIAGTQFITRYVYHHGYYDGQEREFRGFGMVEQWDAESITSELPDQAIEIPPVHTKTWFHTGAFIDRRQISLHFGSEYFSGDQDAVLLPDTQLPPGLTAEEARQACRALRGKVLRKEIFSDDHTTDQDKPYLVTEQNYDVRLLQPAGEGPYAVFYVNTAETLTYHYERNPADPRINHQMTLQVDEYGNVIQSAEIGYPRRVTTVLPEQVYRYITITEQEVINRPHETTWYRIGLPSEQRSYELTGEIGGEGFYLSRQDILNALSLATEIPYHESPSGSEVQKRILSHSRIRYLKNDMSGPANWENEDEKVESLALVYESYTKAFSPNLIRQVFGDNFEDLMLIDEAGYVKLDDDWWIPSGLQTYDADNFYSIIAITDPFGNETSLEYDPYYLGIKATTTPAPASNRTSAEFDYRVLQPYQKTDPNGNRSMVAFDALGMVVGSVVMGKEGEDKGDNLNDFVSNLDQDTITHHIINPLDNPNEVLAGATTRMIYDLWRYQREGKPSVVYSLSRETHLSELKPGQKSKVQHHFLYSDGSGRELMSKSQAEPGPAPMRDPLTGEILHNNGIVQMAEIYSRWVGTGRTIYNNKGTPVKQYEPFFSDTHTYETEQELVEWGVTNVLHYDPLGRLQRTDAPNGTFIKNVIDPWQQESWDSNDTVLDSDWYNGHNKPDPYTDPEPANPEIRSAWLAAEHANTPSIQYQDSLGRHFLSLAHNRRFERDTTGQLTTVTEIMIPTRTFFDIEGQILQIRDGRGIDADPTVDPLIYEGGNIVVQNIYGMGGIQLFHYSMDSGERRLLPNVVGNPFIALDSRGFIHTFTYDELQRMTEFYVQQEDQQKILVERNVYGESQPDPEENNLRGQVYARYDGAGVVYAHQFDFKGNLLRSSRRFTQEYTTTLDWSEENPLNSETFEQQTSYDALNRPISMILPDMSETMPTYNEANMVETVQIRLRGGTGSKPVVTNIDYNARGQREKIEYANGVSSFYNYDPLTFRLLNLKSLRTADRTVLEDYVYTYDPAGNIVEIKDNARQNTFYNNAQISNRSKFRYDAFYQLISANGREHIGQAGQPSPYDPAPLTAPHPNNAEAMRNYTQEYSYDTVGNILSMIHHAAGGNWRRHYLYAQNNNQLISTNHPGDGANTPFTDTYSYDQHGNMTAMPHLGEIGWDYKDQMQQVDLGGGGTVFYIYDSSGKRVRKIHRQNGSTVEERFYIGDFEIYRRHLNNTLTHERQTILLKDGQKIIALFETKVVDTEAPTPNPQTVIRYQLGNHIDSTSLELDEQGFIISYEEYYPFGATAYRATTGSIEVSAKRYRYTGKEKDEETGLYYHGARYYACWLGRWCSPDPAGVKDGLNVYRYSGNRPTSITDPSGLAGEDMVDGQLEFMHTRNNEVVVYADSKKGFWDTKFGKGLAFAGGVVAGVVTGVVIGVVVGAVLASAPAWATGAAIIAGVVGIGATAVNAYNNREEIKKQVRRLKSGEATAGEYFSAGFAAGDAAGMVGGGLAAGGKAAVRGIRGTLGRKAVQKMAARELTESPTPTPPKQSSPFPSEFMDPPPPPPPSRALNNQKAALQEVLSRDDVLQFTTPKGQTNPQTVFSGHGFHDQPDFVMPEGTYLSIYGRVGEPVSNQLGRAIEQGLPSAVPLKVYKPGDVVPGLRLGAFEPTRSLGNPIRVWNDTGTPLQELLRPGIGHCHWAACLSDLSETGFRLGTQLAKPDATGRYIPDFYNVGQR